MGWVMTSEKTEKPVEIHFYIGTLCVATIFFVGRSGVALRTLYENSTHETVSEAMKEMHRKLKAPRRENGDENGNLQDRG